MKIAMVSAFVHLSLGALGLVGCSHEEAPARTVSWFQQHPEERKAMVARCADDPGRLGNSPNCVNATRAESIEGVGSLRKLPPLGLDPNRKPGFDEGEKPSVRP